MPQSGCDSRSEIRRIRKPGSGHSSFIISNCVATGDPSMGSQLTDSSAISTPLSSSIPHVSRTFARCDIAVFNMSVIVGLLVYREEYFGSGFWCQLIQKKRSRWRNLVVRSHVLRIPFTVDDSFTIQHHSTMDMKSEYKSRTSIRLFSETQRSPRNKIIASAVAYSIEMQLKKKTRDYIDRSRHKRRSSREPSRRIVHPKCIAEALLERRRFNRTRTLLQAIGSMDVIICDKLDGIEVPYQ
jgi:hypothetical protein